jgi:hypothetical protein
VGEAPTESTRSSLVERLGGTAKALTGVVGLISAIVTLAILVWPRGSEAPKPKPAPPGEVSGFFTAVRLGPRVPARTYVGLGEATPVGNPSRASLMVPGHLVYLRATVRGFAGKWLWVSWSVISSKSHERVTGPGFTAFKDPKTGRYRPLPRGVLPTILLIQPIARIHKTEITVWVPIPSRKGRFFAQLVIEDNRGRHFASAKTPPFNGDPGIRAVPPNFAPPIGG